MMTVMPLRNTCKHGRWVGPADRSTATTRGNPG